MVYTSLIKLLRDYKIYMSGMCKFTMRYLLLKSLMYACMDLQLYLLGGNTELKKTTDNRVEHNGPKNTRSLRSREPCGQKGTWRMEVRSHQSLLQ